MVSFQLDVVRRMRKSTLPPAPASSEEKTPGYIDFRRLSIRCMEGCKGDVRYEEEFIDSIISAFQLYDGSNDLITIWSGGSSYWIRVYHLGPDRITKVMDTATKSAPQFMYDQAGSALIILNNSDSAVPQGALSVRGNIWKWDGLAYSPVAGIN